MKIFFIGLFTLLGLIIIYLILAMNLKIIEEQTKGERFTAQDGMILYELCQKKSGSKTKFILQSYGDMETPFKDFLLKK